MKITLSPVSCYAAPLAVSVSGETITVDGVALDLSSLPDNAQLPAGATGHAAVIGAVSRVGGEISLTLRFPVGPFASEAARFPAPITATVGVVELPDPGFVKKETIND